MSTYWVELTTFFGSAVVISFSGVLAPGPVMAATLAAGAKRRHAGALIALGHGAVEFPLMFLILAGIGVLLRNQGVKIGIGLLGGAMLVLMGIQMLAALRAAATPTSAGPAKGRHPFWTGVLLTGGNPYFLLWWATVGLALASQAAEFGAAAFGAFAIIHWLCDFGWLEAMSIASHKGSRLFGDRMQQIVLLVCGGALVVFGGMFLFDAGWNLLGVLGWVTPPAADS